MSDLVFESGWDDRRQVWRVSVFGLEDEPVELPGIARLGRLHALRPCVTAAVCAAPSAMSDENGLYWRTEAEARKAAKAAAATTKRSHSSTPTPQRRMRIGR